MTSCIRATPTTGAITTTGENDTNVTKKTKVEPFAFGASSTLPPSATPVPPADNASKGKISFSFGAAATTATPSESSATINQPSSKKRKDDVFSFGAAPAAKAAKPATLAFGAAPAAVDKPATTPGGATAAPALGSITGGAAKSNSNISGGFSFGGGGAGASLSTAPVSNGGGISQDPGSSMANGGQGDSAPAFKFGSDNNKTAVKTTAETPKLNFAFGSKPNPPSTTSINTLPTMGGPPSSTPSFSFGAGSATNTTAPNPLMPKHPSNDHLGNNNAQEQQRSSKKRCNDEKTTTTTQAPVFAFGAAPLPTTTAPAPAPSNAPFAFGSTPAAPTPAPTITAPASSNAMFAFGSTPAAPPPAPTPSFPPLGGTAPQPFGSNPTSSTAGGPSFSFGGGAPTPAATVGGGGGGASFAFGSNNASMNAPVGAQAQPFAASSFGATAPVTAPAPTMNFGAAVPQQQQQQPPLQQHAFGNTAQQPPATNSFGGFGGSAGAGFSIGTSGGGKAKGATRRRIVRAKRPPAGKR